MSTVFKARYIPALILLLAYATTGKATTAIIPSDDDMVVGARSIVGATVLSTFSALDYQSACVYTYTTLRVGYVLKGDISTAEIVIKEPGGEAAGVGSVVYGSPGFTPGEEVLLYLDTWSDGSLRVHQMFLGKFRVIPDNKTGQVSVLRDTSGANVEIMSNNGIAASAAATDQMELSAYVRMLREKITRTATRAKEFEATFYHNVPLLAEPPEYRERSRTSGVQPQFHLWNPPLRRFEVDSGQPVSLTINPDGAPDAQISDDVAAAMSAWSTVPGCSLRIIIGGTSSDCPHSGGPNVIYFNNCDGFFSPSPSCAGLLAFTRNSYSTSSTKVINGTTFFPIFQSFVSLNPYAACNFGQRSNVQEVATHELGHAMGLAHSWDPAFGGAATPTDLDATMYYAIHFDARAASLKADDKNGIVFLYPGSGQPGAGAPRIMTSSTLAAGSVGAAYSLALAARGGTPPYTWGLQTGSSPLPPGLGIDSAGTISGVPTSAGAFSFTATVTDATSQTSQQDFFITINAPVAARAAQFVSQTVPSVVSPGQAFNVTITWNNTGAESWSDAAGIKMGSQNPTDNTTWGGDRVSVPGGSIVSSGQQVTLTFTAYAPASTGSYNFQWQMLKEGSGSFGNMTPNAAIDVTNPDTPLVSGVKFKGGGKLIVRGDNFDAGAVVLVDGVQEPTRAPDSGMLVVKPLSLSSGTHDVRVQNSSGRLSNQFMLAVN